MKFLTKTWVFAGMFWLGTLTLGLHVEEDLVLITVWSKRFYYTFVTLFLVDAAADFVLWARRLVKHG